MTNPEKHNNFVEVALPWLILVVIFASSVLNYLLNRKFAVQMSQSAHQPPWDVIRRDFISGISYGIPLLVSLIIGRLTWKSYENRAWLMMWLSAVWCGGRAWQGVVIFFNTTHIMQPALATTSWTTFSAYFSDWLIWTGQIVLYVSLGVLILRRKNVFEIPG